MTSINKAKDYIIKYTGVPVLSAERAVIMIHGRGADAEDILSVSKEIWLPDTAYVAPEAEGNTWYPYSFLSPIEQNQPDLNKAFDKLKYVLDEVNKANIPNEKIYWLGFSQGACLALDFTARNAQRFGGIFALSGGLIGESINRFIYKHNFNGTPIFLGCSDIDPHIPVERVNESAEVLKELGAQVKKEIYPGMGHNINQDELDRINEIILQK